MAWFDMGSTRKSQEDHPSDEDIPASFMTEAQAGEDPEGRVARALLTPLRTEVSRVDGPPCDTAFRQLLGQIQYDLDSGLTSHSAQRAEEKLATEMPVWLVGRRAAEKERVEQITSLLGSLGESLFKMQNRDDKSAARIRDGLTHIEANSSRTSHAMLKRIVANMLKAIDDMKTENQRRVSQMSAKIRELHQEVAEKTLEAQIDRLTGINNRATFDDHLARVIKRSTIAPLRFTLLAIDIDHFKAVNDTYGHLEGDRALKRVAIQLERMILRKGDLIARYGGEEFAVVLSDADADSGRKAAEAIRGAVEEMEILLGSQTLRLTVSVGVAEGCRADTSDKLIRRADDCLYIAKKAGRNRVVVAGTGKGTPIRLPRELADRARAVQRAKRTRRPGGTARDQGRPALGGR
jgi:diguanylate cyclase (GGDEF)-like protein